MAFVVARKFNTPSRRFAVGQTVTPQDIAGAVTFDQWKERGFIVEGPLPTASLTSKTDAAREKAR
jgi:hypothetical protein